MIDLGHGREPTRLDLGRAARNDDARRGVLTPRPADRLARLAHGLSGHRAGVDDDSLGDSRGGGLAKHDLGLVGVEAAAEDDDARRTHGRTRASPGSFASRAKMPLCSTSAGPVIKTRLSARHSISRGPPGTVTMTRRPVRPRRAAATAAAQAAE